MSFSALLLGVHDICLLVLATVAGIHAAVTVLNRLHLRRVLMSWLDLRSVRVSIWGSVALVVSASICAWSAYVAGTVSAGIIIGYGLTLFFGTVSAMIVNTVAVTEYGIVNRLNSHSKHIAWGQVEDYFTRQTPYGSECCFLHQDESGTLRRFTVFIPARFQKEFEQILATKLDGRFYNAVRRPRTIKTHYKPPQA